jgi:transposase
LINSELVLGLPGYQITGIERVSGQLRLRVRHAGPVACPHCGGLRLRSKGRCDRTLRHSVIELEARKFQCRECGRQFRQRFPGILPWQRASEAFQRQIFRLHLDGINRSLLGRREGIGAATVQRYFQAGLVRQFGQWHPPRCPTVLGIDEHFFTRRQGFATTLVDLRRHKVYDVVLGRSETALAAYFERLEGKAEVKLVCMDLSSCYRSLVRKYFPNALIVADRFHVIRLINHHFLACWRELDPVGSKNRGLVSLMRRHRHNLKPEQLARLMNYLAGLPAMELIYRFKQRLCYLLLKKHRSRKQCQPLAVRLLKALDQLRGYRHPPQVQKRRKK